jgi:hypothetical protein
VPELERLLDMAKLRPALLKGQPRFKYAYLKPLGDDWVFNKDGKTHVKVGGHLPFFRTVAWSSST